MDTYGETLANGEEETVDGRRPEPDAAEQDGVRTADLEAADQEPAAVHLATGDEPGFAVGDLDFDAVGIALVYRYDSFDRRRGGLGQQPITARRPEHQHHDRERRAPSGPPRVSAQCCRRSRRASSSATWSERAAYPGSGADWRAANRRYARSAES